MSSPKSSFDVNKSIICISISVQDAELKFINFDENQMNELQNNALFYDTHTHKSISPCINMTRQMSRLFLSKPVRPSVRPSGLSRHFALQQFEK